MLFLTDLDADVQNIGCINKCKTAIKAVIFALCLIIYILFLIAPITLYNLYHSLPSENTLPVIKYFSGNDIFLFGVERLTAILIAFQQWLLIPKFISLLIYLYPFNNLSCTPNSDHGSTSHQYKNLIIQLSRNITFILVPFCVLIIFDDKCMQNWKIFWQYCDSSADVGPSNQCTVWNSVYEFNGSNRDSVWACFDVCAKQFEQYRCVRQIFQVLGPLYTIKATVALAFPLMYFFKGHIKRIYKSRCKKDMVKENLDIQSETAVNNYKYSHMNADTINYIGLISSLEIIVVFGWGVPILIVIYNIVMFGYGTVYFKWFCSDASRVESALLIDENDSKSHQTIGYIKIAGKWLIFSMVMQQLLAVVFYFYTQSNVLYSIVIGANSIILLIMYLTVTKCILN